MKYFKILLVAAALLSFAVCSQAQTWYPTDEVTIAWDLPTTNVGGDPLEDPVRTHVFIVPRASTDKEADKISVGITAAGATEHTVTVSDRGFYWFGMLSEIVFEGEPTGVVSATIWSDDPAACKDGETFGVIHFQVPSPPSSMHKPTE